MSVNRARKGMPDGLPRGCADTLRDATPCPCEREAASEVRKARNLRREIIIASRRRGALFGFYSFGLQRAGPRIRGHEGVPLPLLLPQSGGACLAPARTDSALRGRSGPFRAPLSVP